MTVCEQVYALPVALTCCCIKSTSLSLQCLQEGRRVEGLSISQSNQSSQHPKEIGTLLSNQNAARLERNMIYRTVMSEH